MKKKKKKKRYLLKLAVSYNVIQEFVTHKIEYSSQNKAI